MVRGVSGRVAGVGRSATVSLFDLVGELRAAGRSVVDVSGGQPDFATGEHVVAAAVAALHEGFTHYTASRGLPELRELVSAKLLADNGIAVPPADVVITPSAKHGLYAALLTLLDPGDEVVVPTPSWVSYQAMARLVGGVPVEAELSGANGFRLTREVLEGAVSGRTKAVLVNTPNNPTGRALDAEEARVLAEFAVAHDLYVVADEIYEAVLFDGRRHLSVAALPGCAERTLTVNGFSKSHAMTGWRLGWVAGPGAVMAELVKVQEHTVSCAGSFVQRGGIAALSGPEEYVAGMVESYDRRRRVVVDGLNALPGVSCALPEGTFYAFADISGAGKGGSVGFAEWALRDAGVAVTPGVAFGAGGEGYVRLSFAAPVDVVHEALARLARALG
ncbi:aspartate aminotransferase [Actinokineospora spheciospongiae]|nr:aspartate aminotransferase [Actinokineospora spheciospongiae]